MAHRPPRLGWMAPAGVLAAVVAVGFGLSGLLQPHAPEDPQVCWRMSGGAGGAPVRFTRFGEHVPGLESCAGRLEAEFLRGGARGEVNGAYQGRFIFIDREAVWSADTLHGGRWRVFYDPDRKTLDARLRNALGVQEALAARRAASDGRGRVSLARPPPAPAP